MYLEKKVKYCLKAELFIQLAIRQWGNVRTLGHYPTASACEPKRKSSRIHPTGGRKRFAMTPPRFSNAAIYTVHQSWHWRTTSGSWGSTVGEDPAWRRSAIFSPCLVSSLRPVGPSASSEQELGAGPGFCAILPSEQRSPPRFGWVVHRLGHQIIF